MGPVILHLTLINKRHSTMPLHVSQVCWYFPGEMLDEVTAVVDGYNAYFSFSKVKTGYSGKDCNFFFT